MNRLRPYFNIVKPASLLTTLLMIIMASWSTAATASDWSETRKLSAIDASYSALFGQSIGLDGDIAIIGAHRADTAATDNAGAAYVMDIRTGATLFKLTANDAADGDYFGHSVDISGNHAIAGAYYENVQRGAAYLFDLTTGQQTFKLVAEHRAQGDEFGKAVAISGQTAIVGSVGEGQAHLFDVVTGQRTKRLQAQMGLGPWEQFGSSVAIDGNLAVVGSYKGSDTDNVRTGAIYVYNATTGQQLRKITPANTPRDTGLGTSVDISGNHIIAGATNDETYGKWAGAAYIFNANTGQLMHKLFPNDIASEARFGQSVAISGNYALIGSRSANNYEGAAYLFDVTTGNQLAKFAASDAKRNDIFGWSVAIDETAAVIGAYSDDRPVSDAGSAYVFQEPSPVPAPMAIWGGAVGLACLSRRGRRS